MARTAILVTIDDSIVDKALAKLDKDFKVPISQAAMVRVLLGLYGEGAISINIDDLQAYSPESFRRRQAKQSNQRDEK